jgi:hypothetical protein
MSLNLKQIKLLQTALFSNHLNPERGNIIPRPGLLWFMVLWVYSFTFYALWLGLWFYSLWFYAFSLIFFLTTLYVISPPTTTTTAMQAI